MSTSIAKHSRVPLRASERPVPKHPGWSASRPSRPPPPSAALPLLGRRARGGRRGMRVNRVARSSLRLTRTGGECATWPAHPDVGRHALIGQSTREIRFAVGDRALRTMRLAPAARSRSCMNDCGRAARARGELSRSASRSFSWPAQRSRSAARRRGGSHKSRRYDRAAAARCGGRTSGSRERGRPADEPGDHVRAVPLVGRRFLRGGDRPSPRWMGEHRSECRRDRRVVAGTGR